MSLNSKSSFSIYNNLAAKDTYCGDGALLSLQKEQLHEFRQWSNLVKWDNFHSNHFDWWVFPINESSRYNKLFSVPNQNIQCLKENLNFLADYRELAGNVYLSWGWNLTSLEPLKESSVHQAWNNNSIRLYKSIKSFSLFAQIDLLRSALQFFYALGSTESSFVYCGRNLSQEIREIAIQQRDK